MKHIGFDRGLSLKIGYRLIPSVVVQIPQVEHKPIKKPFTLKKEGIVFTMDLNMKLLGPKNDLSLKPE